MDICLNVEVNFKDFMGIIVLYWLFVLKFFYEYNFGDDEILMFFVEKCISGGGRFKKLLSFRRKLVDRGYVEDDDS